MLHPSSLVIPQGWGLIDLPLRASNEGFLKPRRCASRKGTWPLLRLRASIKPLLSVLFPVSRMDDQAAPAHSFQVSLVTLLRRADWLILYCARRTRPFLGRAFREQRKIRLPSASIPFSIVVLFAVDRAEAFLMKQRCGVGNHGAVPAKIDGQILD